MKSDCLHEIEKTHGRQFSHKVSTLVEDSVSSLSGRVSELEHVIQSRTTTPVTDDNATMVEAMEQAFMFELEKMKEEHLQAQTELFNMCGKLYATQKSQEKQISGLRRFARHVELFLDQLDKGAPAPQNPSHTLRLDDSGPSVPQAYVPGASVSSSTRPSSCVQAPEPPTFPAPPAPGETTATVEGGPPPEPCRVKPTCLAQ